MNIAIATLQSLTPYSQSRYHNTDKKGKETPQDYEKRTWREKLHVTPEDSVFIPPMTFKNCLSSAAKFRGDTIPGRGKRTYTKLFESNSFVFEGLDLGIKKADVESEELFLPSDGQRGGGRRVMKTFPIIHDWSGKVTFHINNEQITEEVFRTHLEEAGSSIGIGRFRPENNGYYGRFEVADLEWIEKD